MFEDFIFMDPVANLNECANAITYFISLLHLSKLNPGSKPVPLGVLPFLPLNLTSDSDDILVMMWLPV